MNVKEMQNFFIKGEGKEFVQKIEDLINENHRQAELDPDHSRDFVQRAAGVRDVLNLIKTGVTEVKK